MRKGPAHAWTALLTATLLNACGDDAAFTPGGSTSGTSTHPSTTQGSSTGSTGNGWTSYADTSGGSDPSGSTTGDSSTSGLGVTAGSAGDSGSTGATSGTSGSTGHMAVCGNGEVEVAEVCDDGNVLDEDACSADCQVLAPCVVPVTHSTIQSAVDDRACSIVWIEPGTYPENLVIEHDVDVRRASPGSVTIDGQSQGSTMVVLDGAEVRLRELTITGGYAERGGGIWNAGTLRLEECRVVNNVASGPSPRGGGIHSSGAVRIYGGAVDNNLVTGGETGGTAFGGGVAMDGADLTASLGATFNNNLVDISGVADFVAGGGGIYASHGHVWLDLQVDVIGNQVLLDSMGGALDRYGAAGGGVYVDGDEVIVGYYSWVQDNLVQVAGTSAGTTFASGGGVYVAYGSFEANRGWVVHNIARLLTPTGVAAGGGIHLDDPTGYMVVEQLSLIENEAVFVGNGNASNGVARGGGLHYEKVDAFMPDLWLYESSVSDNRAVADVPGGVAEGGGIYAAATVEGTLGLWLHQSALVENVAQAQLRAFGGGMYQLAGGMGEGAGGMLVNTTVSGNAAIAAELAQGGGVALHKEPGPAIMNTSLRFVTIFDNAVLGASSAGGGLLVSTAEPLHQPMWIRNSIVYGNGAEDCVSEGPVEFSAGLMNAWGDPSGCPSLDVSESIVGLDPQLGPLGDYGGQSRSHLPASGSVVVDFVPDADCMTYWDQRDAARAGTDCDLGAVERQPGDP